jgi:mono/diheme cytochrome c family protein
LGAAAMLCLADREGWTQEVTSSVLDGIYTDAQAARGAAAYPQHCAACHGASLGGLGEAPALTGAQFISDFNGLTVGDLFDRIRTTMPLNNPSGLSRDQYADILSFILKSNGYPAGQKELNRRSEFLNAIRFEAPK